MLIDIPGIQALKLPAGQELKLLQNNHTFEVGQVLKAVVVAAIGERRIMLNLDGANINAKTSNQFLPGEELQIKVDRQDGQTIFKIQNRQFSEQILNQALRHVLPKQAPANNLLQLILNINQLPERFRQQLPAQLLTAFNEVTASLATKEQLSKPEGLKAAIFNSGIFLENKLAHLSSNQTPVVQYDFKAQLLKLMDLSNQLIQQQIASSTNSQHTEPTNKEILSKEVAALLGKSIAEQMTLTPKAEKQLEHAARLKRAANFIRSINFELSHRQTTSNQNNAKPNSTSQTSIMTPQQTKMPIQQNTTENIKYGSIPLKGAIPQPIKYIAQPMELNQTKDFHISLKEELNHVLSRIQTSQLSTMTKENSIQPSFLFDLPLVSDNGKADVIPILIEQEESTDNKTDKNQKNWAITIALNLENLGSMQIKASLREEQVAITIWSEQVETKKLFEHKDPLLKEALQQDKLKIHTLLYHHGLKENKIDSATINMLDLNI